MRNAVARRPHRERAQELERDRLGLLEKRKVNDLILPLFLSVFLAKLSSTINPAIFFFVR
jgi:hypothetical protein